MVVINESSFHYPDGLSKTNLTNHSANCISKSKLPHVSVKHFHSFLIQLLWSSRIETSLDPWLKQTNGSNNTISSSSEYLIKMPNFTVELTTWYQWIYIWTVHKLGAAAGSWHGPRDVTLTQHGPQSIRRWTESRLKGQSGFVELHRFCPLLL